MTTHARQRTTNNDILRIACWNIGSWRNKDQEIVTELKEHKIDICGISETRKKGRGSVLNGDYLLTYSGVEKHRRAFAGVGILIHKKYIDHITDTKYIDERIVTVKLTFKNTTLNIISVYAPDISKTKLEKEVFYENLQDHMTQYP